MSEQTVIKQILRKGETDQRCDDHLAIEEPLEIRLVYEKEGVSHSQSLSITMRTPGHDFELAMGFLISENILSTYEDIDKIDFCGPKKGELNLHNIVKVELKPGTNIEWSKLQRHFYTTSSCGVCGKTSLEALENGACKRIEKDDFTVDSNLIYQLPSKLRTAQEAFGQTGGLHATALFNNQGKLLCLREDVGRHNAMDKVVGYALKQEHLPLKNNIILWSGRASFELMQKAAIAGVPLVAAIGAPSNLAVDIAIQFNLTLIGFLKQDRMNVYHGGERLI
jgi:FdhD protein